MKKIILSMICFCVCLPMVAAAIISDDYDVQFVNNRTEEFTGLVGQFVMRTGLVRFADAEIPPDPNPPVDRANGAGMNQTRIYSVEIEGADASQFTAMVVWRSFTSNECTIQVCYRPQALGTHTATLWAYCSSAGVPTVKIPLRGEATGVLGDLTGDGVININDVTGMVNLLLMGEKESQPGDFNCDGQFNISDVSSLINKLLRGD